MLAGGCVALVTELDWFEDQAARRGIDLEQPALPATLAYRELLGRLDATPYEAAVTALWVLERVYLLAWAFAASDTSPFGEFIEHWSAPAFADYVDALGVLAIPDRYDKLVADVLTHEVVFWDMTLSARLWADNGDLAAAALAHRFVSRLGDGSLPREIFAGYVAGYQVLAGSRRKPLIRGRVRNSINDVNRRCA
jgi:thiaminase